MLTGASGGRAVVRPISCTGRSCRRAHWWTALAAHIRPWHGPIDTVL